MRASSLPEQGAFWGASIGQQFTGSNPPWDWNAVLDFERNVAGVKGVSVLPFGAQFYSMPYCHGPCDFATSLFQEIRSQGVIPWFSWQSTSSAGERGYTDAEIAAGYQDAYIRQWAQAAKAWGHPLFLRFDWEMNGNWWPWSAGVDGNTAAAYVAMWRHVHDIFTSVGASNVTWVWCPNVDPDGRYASLASLYPGSSYVDWTCLDGYNASYPWTSFQDLYSSSYNALVSLAPAKPIILGEVASTEHGGSKAAWIRYMFASLETEFTQIRGLLWYDVYSPGATGYSDWPIETSSSAEAAFDAGISSPRYVSSDYRDLPAATIAPPTVSGYNSQQAGGG